MERGQDTSLGASRTPMRRSTRLNGPAPTEIVNVDEIREEEDDGPKPADRDQPVALPVTEASSESEEDEDATLRDIRPAFLRRSDLNELMLLDDWTTLVRGCFVRIPVGRNEHGLSNYRVGRINRINVGQQDDGEQILPRYEFEVDLGDRRRSFFLRNISNSVITENEWNLYMMRTREAGSRVSRREIQAFIEERSSRSQNLQFAPEFRHLHQVLSSFFGAQSQFMARRRDTTSSPTTAPGTPPPIHGSPQFQRLVAVDEIDMRDHPLHQQPIAVDDIDLRHTGGVLPSPSLAPMQPVFSPPPPESQIVEEAEGDQLTRPTARRPITRQQKKREEKEVKAEEKDDQLRRGRKRARSEEDPIVVDTPERPTKRRRRNRPGEEEAPGEGGQAQRPVIDLESTSHAQHDERRIEVPAAPPPTPLSLEEALTQRVPLRIEDTTGEQGLRVPSFAPVDPRHRVHALNQQFMAEYSGMELLPSSRRASQRPPPMPQGTMSDSEYADYMLAYNIQNQEVDAYESLGRHLGLFPSTQPQAQEGIAEGDAVVIPDEDDDRPPLFSQFVQRLTAMRTVFGARIPRRQHFDGGSHQPGAPRLDQMMLRDLTPEDYELLLRLDERLENRRAATSKEMKNLKKLHSEDTPEWRERQCGICLIDYEPEQDCIQLPCGHIFHDSCIKQWLEIQAVCPVCKRSIRNNQ